MECSDESFVKVPSLPPQPLCRAPYKPESEPENRYLQVFAFGSRDNLGGDLGELLKEFRLSPYQLRNPTVEDSSSLQEEVSELLFVTAVNKQALELHKFTFHFRSDVSPRSRPTLTIS